MTLFGISLLAALLAADEAYDTSAEPIVAAISYTGNTPPDGNLDCEELANDDFDEELCEVEALVRSAVEQGAQLVVISEGAFELDVPEALPSMGRIPHGDDAPALWSMSTLAADLQIFLVVPMHTRDRGETPYSSLIAFGPRGRTVGIHHKIELYSAEKDEFAPGKQFGTFETPWGTVAMLLCSDLYAEPELHRSLERDDVDIVVVSSLWTVSGAQRWQAAFAHDWELFVIAANGSGNTGKGSGIYGRDGRSLASDDSGFDTVIVSTLRDW